MVPDRRLWDFAPRPLSGIHSVGGEQEAARTTRYKPCYDECFAFVSLDADDELLLLYGYRIALFYSPLLQVLAFSVMLYEYHGELGRAV